MSLKEKVAAIVGELGMPPDMPAITALAASRGDGRSAWRSCGAKGTGIAPGGRLSADEPSERRVAAVGAFFEEKKLSAASGTFTVAPGIALQSQVAR